MNKVLQDKIDWIMHRRQIKKEVLEKRKDLLKKRQARKEHKITRKPKPRLSIEIKNQIILLLENGTRQTGYCNLCGKKLSSGKILWCSNTCNSRFGAEKTKSKNL